MRFEGTVTINAPRNNVWETLMCNAIFAQITPGVSDVHTVVEQRQYLLDVGLSIASTPTTLQATIIWDDVREAERLVWHSCVPYGGQQIALHGTMEFSGEDPCQIDFASEIKNVPASLPPSLVHKITSAGIRQFFTNLKSVVEKAPA